MTSVFSIVQFVLYTRVLQYAQQSTEKKKEQSSQLGCFVIWLCRLLFDACSIFSFDVLRLNEISKSDKTSGGVTTSLWLFTCKNTSTIDIIPYFLH